MEYLPRPGHVSTDRLVSLGAAIVRVQTPAVGSDLAAPSQAVFTHDELLDARQVARAVQASWSDHSQVDDELASLWPLARLPLIDEQSGLATTSSRAPPAAFSKGLQHPHTCRSAGAKVQGLSVKTRSKARQAQHRSAGPRGKRVRHKQGRSISAASASDSGTGSEDSIHTAHFSDEGELSDMDDEVASAQATSAKRQKPDAGVKVLYHGPSSDQLAAAAAAAMAPAGPRPLLGDVLSEVIHVQDVKRSACATGVPDEPLKEEDWRCIMRHKNAVGREFEYNLNRQLMECGHQNHWYVRQCVLCDASRWDIELRERVSAILQTSRTEQTSTRQVINRLKAFSSGPPGLSPAFTLAMVQQAIDDCLALQAPTAQRKRPLHASNSAGAVIGQADLDRPIRGPIEGQSQLAEQLMAAAGLPTAAEEMTHPASSDQQGQDQPDASKPIEQEWGSTALALHQALSALAPPQAFPGVPRSTAHPAHLPRAPAIASTCEPPQAEGASHQLNSSGLLHSQQTGADGMNAAVNEAAGVSTELQGAVYTGDDSQAAVAQGYHFATDLLDAVLRQQGRQVHAGCTNDLPAAWARPRKPWQLAVTASQQHRKLFQMPALPKHQPQQTTWKKKPTTPAVSVHYPIPPSRMAADATKPLAQPEPSGGNNNKKRRMVAAHRSLHDSPAGLQEADVEARHQAEPQGLRQRAGGDLESSAGVNSAEGTHYNPQGLGPTPAARALAGPTVHILVEGYDVYTESGIGLTRGNAFPASEVTKVSQNSRHLWLQQRPFQLKRSTAEELATGAYKKGSGTKNNKPNKVDTVKIALDRQGLAGPPCSIGNAQHKSAFHTFAGPSTPSMPPNDPSSEGAAISGRPGSVPRAEADESLPHLDGRPSQVPDAMDVPEPGSNGQCQQQQRHEQQQDQLQQRQTRLQSHSAAQALDQLEQSAQGDRKQEADHEEGQASAGTASVDAAGATSAKEAHLQPLGDVAMLDKYRSMEGEAWKVFYIASNMGLRPNVIEKAAARFRMLHQR
ncbi:hypothetical protein WJX77_006750 [Trebouxia sp. C0004]